MCVCFACYVCCACCVLCIGPPGNARHLSPRASQSTPLSSPSTSLPPVAGAHWPAWMPLHGPISWHLNPPLLILPSPGAHGRPGQGRHSQSNPKPNPKPYPYPNPYPNPPQVRADGNVLIPCESAGRALELMQLLGRHWGDGKVGLYHLVFPLSPDSIPHPHLSPWRRQGRALPPRLPRPHVVQRARVRAVPGEGVGPGEGPGEGEGEGPG